MTPYGLFVRRHGFILASAALALMFCACGGVVKYPDKGTDAGVDQVVADKGQLDKQVPDGAVADLASPDKAVPDAAVPDSALPDTHVTDKDTPDFSIPDVLVPDLKVPDMPPPITCTDKIKNGAETDVDCGGAKCPKCPANKKCVKLTDCTSGLCSGGKCLSACVHSPVTKDCRKDTAGAEWCRIPAGCFQMGSPSTESCRDKSTEAQHAVILTTSFEIQSTPVTNGQFQTLMGYKPSYNTSGGSDHPVEQVSWHEAAAYCNALSAKQGLPSCYTNVGSNKTCSKDSDCSSGEKCQNKTKCIKYEEATLYKGAKVYGCAGYRLPTEAEWEYAYRAGTKTAYYSGTNDNALCSKCTPVDTNAASIGWYCSPTTKAVGKKTPNAWGLHDMAGNVYEWCHDWWPGPHLAASAKDPWGASSHTTRVLRGGAWDGNPLHIRAAHRAHDPPLTVGIRHGFRPVRTPIVVDDSFAEFSKGSSLEMGVKVYVSKNGNVQMVDRLDLNNDGWLDLVFSNQQDGTSHSINNRIRRSRARSQSVTVASWSAALAFRRSWFERSRGDVALCQKRATASWESTLE